LAAESDDQTFRTLTCPQAWRVWGHPKFGGAAAKERVHFDAALVDLREFDVEPGA